MDPIESYIRTAAAQRGIDPDQAVRVAKSEGLNSYTGDNGSSFGPFQLHYGGVAPGGNAVSGLGDEFTRQTGLDARDPSTVYHQVDFALDHAAQNGWGAWHGWKGDPQAGISSNAAPVMQTAFRQQQGQQAMPDQSQQGVLFGGTPIGAATGLLRMLGIGSDDSMGRRLQNAGAALQSVGNFGHDNSAGAAAMMAAANQPHFSVVTDAYGNRFAIDTRTGQPINMNGGGGMRAPGAPGFNNAAPNPGAQQPQQQPQGPSDYDGLLGPNSLAKAQEDSAKKMDGLNDAASQAQSFIDKNKQMLGYSQGGTVLEGPGVVNLAKQHIADLTAGSVAPSNFNIANQEAYEKGFNQLTGDRLKMIGVTRIAQPEIVYGSQGNASIDAPKETNQQVFYNNIQDAQRVIAARDIALKHYQNGGVLGPGYMKELKDWQDKNPVHQDVTLNANGGGVGMPKVGEVRKGYSFKGGDPSKQENWEKQ